MASDAAPMGTDSERAAVFVSYAHEDRASAEAVVTCLEQVGLRVWWDRLMPPGAEFAPSIEEALEGAAAVVVLWSRTSVHSHWVRDEAMHARDRHRLVPVSLDGGDPPIGFRQHLFIDFSRWDGEPDAPPMRSLVAAIAALHGGAGPKPGPSTPRPARSERAAVAAPAVSRRAVLGGGAALAALLAGGGVLAWRKSVSSKARSSANAVAVLPFENLSGDPGQAYFADGIAAEVRAALARVRDLRVIAQVSSEAFRDGHAGAVAVASALGVGSLLGGSVRRAGSRFRISAELIDGHTGFSRWSQTLERPVDDVFAVQIEIASAVVAALGDVLRANAAETGNPLPIPGGTASVPAYEAYLRGRALTRSGSNEATYRAAHAEFDRAIAIDPKFALAHATRAMSLIELLETYGDAPQPAIVSEAERAARFAVSLAPDCAWAQLSLGFVLLNGALNARGAREPYEMAYQLGGGEGNIVAQFAVFAAETGRQREAEYAVNRALSLDPLNYLVHNDAGEVSYAARRYTESIPRFRRALELSPSSDGVHWPIARSLIALDRAAEAREQCLKESGPMDRYTGLAIVEQRLGNRPAAAAAFERLVTDLGDSAIYQQAEVLAQWGRADEALAALHRARAVGDPGLTYIAYDQLLDPLRGRPEFMALTRELGFDAAG